MNTTEAPARSRRGGRDSRRELRSAHDTTMLPALKRNLPLMEPLSLEQIKKIDKASMDILEEVGVVFRDRIAIEDWRRAGADVRKRLGCGGCAIGSSDGAWTWADGRGGCRG